MMTVGKEVLKENKFKSLKKTGNYKNNYKNNYKKT